MQTDAYTEWALLISQGVRFLTLNKDYTLISCDERARPFKTMTFPREQIADFKWLVKINGREMVLLNLRSTDPGKRDPNRLVVYDRIAETELATLVVNCMNLHEVHELEQRNVERVRFKDGREIRRDVLQKFYMFNEIGEASPQQKEEMKDDKFDPANKYPFFIKQTRSVTQSLLVLTCYQQHEEGDTAHLKDVYYFRFKIYKFNDLTDVWNLTDFHTIVTPDQYINITQGCQKYKTGVTAKMQTISIQVPISQIKDKQAVDQQ
ncbi:hypothetical protein FGO68_gene6433 [Halteria grandinella]|uniref:Uncharacterized protein n=1 Tax=Halteria grandinella TaxID=5974 RepID=A0A8J8NCL9_HALGN|nr:hypothetical protein FGO68_gene6433 [Halteria grandinella]